MIFLESYFPWPYLPLILATSVYKLYIQQIRYYAKSGKLKILKAVLKKATVSSDLKLVDWKSQKGCTGELCAILSFLKSVS